MPEATKPRLKLYYASPSRASTAMWMLEELGEPYEIEAAQPQERATSASPNTSRINPMGKVPTHR